MQFSPKMRLYFFYTVVQKSQKWPKTQIKEGVLLEQKLVLLRQKNMASNKACKDDVVTIVWIRMIASKMV